MRSIFYGGSPGFRAVRMIAFIVALAGALFMHPVMAAASYTNTYDFNDAVTLNASTYDWGYKPCPSKDPGCMSMRYWADSSWGQADPWNQYLRNCTSYVAWEVNRQFGISTAGWGVVNGVSQGAKGWHISAQNAGYSVGNTPQVGDIANWGSSAGAWGHVGYVYAVNNGIASIAEYNWGSAGNFRDDRRVGAVGTLGAPDWYIHLGTPSGGGGGTPTGSPARSDVDGNGRADLFAMTPTASGSAGYSLVSSNQSFVTQYWWDGTGLGWSGVAPMVGDVNGDKKADLVFLTNEAPNGTKAFVSLSNGTSFGSPQLWWDGVGWGYAGIKASLGDIDNNGGEDLVITTNEATGSKAFVLFSTWQSFLAPQLRWDGVGYGWSGITPMVGDVNGDKKADYILLTDEGTNGTKAFVATSNGGSSLNALQLWFNGVGMSYTGIKPTIGDVDGNGGTDLVITTSEATGSKAFVMLSTWQSFLSPQMWWDGVGFAWSGITPFTGDVTGDKKADFVIMTNEGTSGTKMFTGISNGTNAFGSPQLWWDGVGWGYAGIKAYLK